MCTAGRRSAPSWCVSSSLRFWFCENRVQAGHTSRTACLSNLLHIHTSKPFLRVASTLIPGTFASIGPPRHPMHRVMQGGLWEHITAREHIEIYAAIKSLPQPVRSSEPKKRSGRRYQSCNELTVTQTSSGDSCHLKYLVITHNGCLWLFWL